MTITHFPSFGQSIDVKLWLFLLESIFTYAYYVIQKFMYAAVFSTCELQVFFSVRFNMVVHAFRKDRLFVKSFH